MLLPISPIFHFILNLAERSVTSMYKILGILVLCWNGSGPKVETVEAAEPVVVPALKLDNDYSRLFRENYVGESFRPPDTWASTLKQDDVRPKQFSPW